MQSCLDTLPHLAHLHNSQNRVPSYRRHPDVSHRDTLKRLASTP